VATNASGAISTWAIGANYVNLIDGIITINTTAGEQCANTTYTSGLVEDLIGVNYPTLIGALNSNNSGTWALSVTTSAVPEPSAFVLLGSGLLSVVGFARRKLIS